MRSIDLENDKDQLIHFKKFIYYPINKIYKLTNLSKPLTNIQTIIIFNLLGRNIHRSLITL